MSEQQASTENAQEQKENLSLFDQVIDATKEDAQQDYTNDLVKTLVENAIEGTVVWDGSLLKTVEKSVAMIDKIISDQVTQILHDSKFQRLEGSWRGLHHLVKNSLCSKMLKIRVFNSDKKTLLQNFNKAAEFDQSELFKKIYEEEYGSAGGEPYGALIGDYEFNNMPEDVDFLRYMSEIAAASFAPFVASSSSSIMGLKSWQNLNVPIDLGRVFDSPVYAKWNNFRKTDESRFVVLTMPRTLARQPYGKLTKSIEEFNYEEFRTNEEGVIHQVDPASYCWMNTAFVYGAVLTKAFAETGFCTAIRGVENGGKVDNLAAHAFLSDDGELDLACPTEIGITDRREAELSRLGFLPLCHYKGQDYAVFFGGQSANAPVKFDDDDASANSEISARIPYIFATSRIAHYLKVIARDKIGSFMEKSDVETWLNKWITGYVNANPASGQELKSKYPLADAKIIVEEIASKPGSYNAIAYLKPWLQLEELSTSLRLVARIPE